MCNAIYKNFISEYFLILDLGRKIHKYENWLLMCNIFIIIISGKKKEIEKRRFKEKS